MNAMMMASVSQLKVKNTIPRLFLSNSAVLFSKINSKRLHTRGGNAAAFCRLSFPCNCNCNCNGVSRSFTSSGDPTSGMDHHAVFQEQILELEKERTDFCGKSNDQEAATGANEDGMDGQEQHAFFAQELELLEQERKAFFGESNPNATFDSSATAEVSSFKSEEDSGESNMTPEELDKMHEEREAMFDFSDEEKQTWSQLDFKSTGGKLSSQLMMEIAEARNAVERGEVVHPAAPAASAVPAAHQRPSAASPQESPQEIHHHHSSFSHLSEDGDSVHMVDVGQKEITKRTAEAQTKVILPCSVLEAFRLNATTSDRQDELIGPKGPILATAKLAGIMAAKKTSDLIPLCHPLPLDQVQLDIRLVSNEVLINCTCRVTHKTGVEMEALTGASVAALTVYDMVKAVSHEVEITGTKLVAKTGGKRTIQRNRGLVENQE